MMLEPGELYQIYVNPIAKITFVPMWDAWDNWDRDYIPIPNDSFVVFLEKKPGLFKVLYKDKVGYLSDKGLSLECVKN